MKTRNFFVAKFIAVTMMLGLFSPSLTIEKMNTTFQTVSENKIDLSQGLLAGLTDIDISISLFTQAEARGGRRAGRRSGRRANYRHGGGRCGGGRSNNGAAFVGGVVAWAVITSAVSSRNNCSIVYIQGLRYRDCGGGPERY